MGEERLSSAETALNTLARAARDMERRPTPERERAYQKAKRHLGLVMREQHLHRSTVRDRSVGRPPPRG